MNGPELPESIQYISTAIFAIAILHTFLTSKFASLAHRYPSGSVQENLLHLLGEVEVVFGIWAGIFAIALTTLLSFQDAVAYLESRNYTEPLFVFVIMSVCATKPILDLVESVIGRVARFAGRKRQDLAEFCVIMTIGSILGSFITEPAAMTVCALLLLRKFYSRTENMSFKYAMTGLLFVNISIGGTLTSFAAPPVLMVAAAWNWDSAFMLSHFGWKAVIACIVSTAIVAVRFRSDLANLSEAPQDADKSKKRSPWWLTAIHLAFVSLIVVTAHHPAVFIGAFLFFIGVTVVTNEFQSELKLKEGLLVGFFLSGLVVLGGPQGWWLRPVLDHLESFPLFVGAAGLTALTDNAALTYLGSLVPDLSDASKYALVAGAVTGGGLTVIANAPNPAGYGILRASFGPDGIAPMRLLLNALIPTAVAGLCYWCL
jgi:Na+/H+ antiporter NhaD/arsenite permease-like protein